MKTEGESNENKFSSFAWAACNKTKNSLCIEVQLKEVYRLVLAIEKELSRRYPGVEQTKVFHNACDRIMLSCSNCGEYNEDAKGLVLLCANEGFAEKAKECSFSGPIGQAIKNGYCPGCSNDKIIVNYNPDVNRALEFEDKGSKIRCIQEEIDLAKKEGSSEIYLNFLNQKLKHELQKSLTNIPRLPRLEDAYRTSALNIKKKTRKIQWHKK